MEGDWSMKIYDMLLASAMMGEGGGGGGGSSDLTVTLDTLNVPETTLTGEDDGYGGYEKKIDLNVTVPSDLLDGVPYGNGHYNLFCTNGENNGDAWDGVPFEIEGVSVSVGSINGDVGHYEIYASSGSPFTITVSAMTVTYYRMSQDVADKVPVNFSVTHNW